MLNDFYRPHARNDPPLFLCISNLNYLLINVRTKRLQFKPDYDKYSWKKTPGVAFLVFGHFYPLNLYRFTTSFVRDIKLWLLLVYISEQGMLNRVILEQMNFFSCINFIDFLHLWYLILWKLFDRLHVILYPQPVTFKPMVA